MGTAASQTARPARPRPAGRGDGPRPGLEWARPPGAPRLLADYGATVVKVGAGARPRCRADRPAVLRLQRLAGTSGGSPSTSRTRTAGRPSWRWSPGPTWWWRASVPGSWTAWDWATTSGPRNPRIIVCSTSGYGQAGPGRRGPVTTSTTWPSAGTWPRRAPGRRRAPGARGHRRRRRRRAACTPHWPCRGPGGPGGHRRRDLPRRVDRRRGAVADVTGRRRAPGHRGGARAGPRHPHRPVRLLRHLPGPPTGAGWPWAPSSPSSSPTCAACWIVPSGPTTSWTTTPRRRSATTPGGLRHPRPRRVGRGAGRGRHLCGPGPHGVGGRAGRAVRGPPRHRRGRDGRRAPVPSGGTGAGRHGTGVRAGRRARPVGDRYGRAAAGGRPHGRGDRGIASEGVVA